MKILKSWLLGVFVFLTPMAFAASSLLQPILIDEASPQIIKPMGDEDYFYTVNEGQFLTFSKTYGDNPVDNFKIEPTNLPLNAVMPIVQGDGPQTSSFGWTPNYCQGTISDYLFDIGYYRMNVDPNFPEWVGTTHITVSNVNRAPQITTQLPTGTVYVAVGGTLRYNLAATDLDKSECSQDNIYWTNLIQSNYITPENFQDNGDGTATFNWGPLVAGDIGTHTLSFNVTDDFGGKHGKSITVVVYRPSSSPSCSTSTSKNPLRVGGQAACR